MGPLNGKLAKNLENDGVKGTRYPGIRKPLQILLFLLHELSKHGKSLKVD